MVVAQRLKDAHVDSESIDVQELLVALIAVGVKVWRNPARGESFPPSRLTPSISWQSYTYNIRIVYKNICIGQGTCISIL